MYDDAISTATSAVTTSGSRETFAEGFPQRFSDVLVSARGAFESIGDGVAGVDPAALRVYQDIYRLRIELELEAAAVLWSTAEAVAALEDVREALGRGLGGGPIEASAPGVQARRDSVPPVWAPMAYRRASPAGSLPVPKLAPRPIAEPVADPVVSGNGISYGEAILRNGGLGLRRLDTTPDAGGAANGTHARRPGLLQRLIDRARFRVA